MSKELILHSHFDEVQITAFAIIGRIDTTHSIILKIINRLDNALSSEVKVAAINALSMTTGEVLHHQGFLIYDALNQVFLDYDKIVHQAAAQALFKLDSDSIKDALEKLEIKILDPLTTDSQKYAAIDSVGIILELMPVSYIDTTKFITLLSTQVSPFRSITLHALSKIMKHIPIEKQAAIKRELGKELETKVLRHEQEIDTRQSDTFDRISHHCTDSDVNIITRFFDILVFKALRSNSALVQTKLFDLIQKIPKMNHIFIDIVDEQLILIIDVTAKIALIEFVRAKFYDNLELNTLLQERSDELLLDQPNIMFFDINYILDNLDEFQAYIHNNNYDLKFTINTLIIEDIIVLLSPDNNLKENMYISQIIYSAVSGKSLLNRETPHLFSEITNTHLIGNAVQLSIFHKKTTELSYLDTLIVTAEATIFGSLLVNIYSISNNVLVVKTCLSTDANYLTNLFGEANLPVEYTIRTSIVAHNIYSQIISEIALVTEKKELFNIAQKVLQLYPEIEQYKVRLSHNELIRYKAMEEWRTEIEQALDEVEHGISLLNSQIFSFEEELKDLQISQQDTAKIVNTMRALHSIEPTPILTDYQNAIYIEITQTLIKYYLAALVTLTPMVANAQQGNLATAAGVLSKIGASFPVISLGTDLFCQLLLTLDKKTQELISKNIAAVAITPNDMTVIAKQLALKIATSTIDLALFEPQTFTEKFQVVFAAAKGFGDGILTKLVTNLHLANEVNSGASSEAMLGTQHGKLVVKLLISHIITGSFQPNIDTNINYQKLFDSLISEHYITASIIDIPLPPLDISPTASSASSPKTPKKIIDHRNKAKSLAAKIFEYAKKKLDLSQTSNEESLQVLTDSIAWEDCPEEQNLVALSRQNRNLNDKIITSLAKQLYGRKAFKVEENEVTLNTRYITKSIQETKDLLSKFSFIAYNGEKIDIDPGRYANTFMLELDIEASGYGLMKAAEITPSITYLMHNYVPGGKWIMNSDFIKSLPSYDYQTAVIHAAGAGLFVWVNPSQAVPATISTLLHASKLRVYKFTNEQLMLLHHSDEDGWIKFMKFVATDSFASIAIALPLMTTVTPLALGLAFTQGSLTGSISYFNQKTEHENANEAGNILAFLTTSGTLVAVGMLANTRESNIDKVIAASSGIPIAANVHYLSKFIGDFTSENILEFLGSNATETYNNGSLTEEL